MPSLQAPASNACLQNQAYAWLADTAVPKTTPSPISYCNCQAWQRIWGVTMVSATVMAAPRGEQRAAGLGPSEHRCNGTIADCGMAGSKVQHAAVGCALPMPQICLNSATEPLHSFTCQPNGLWVQTSWP